MKKKKFAILVEGYFDVIAFNKLGFNNVASPSGTALTVQQLIYFLDILKKFICVLIMTKQEILPLKGFLKLKIISLQKLIFSN